MQLVFFIHNFLKAQRIFNKIPTFKLIKRQNKKINLNLKISIKPQFIIITLGSLSSSLNYSSPRNKTLVLCSFDGTKRNFSFIKKLSQHISSVPFCWENNQASRRRKIKQDEKINYLSICSSHHLVISFFFFFSSTIKWSRTFFTHIDRKLIFLLYFSTPNFFSSMEHRDLVSL